MISINPGLFKRAGRSCLLDEEFIVIFGGAKSEE
jgi:hypothetical protein